jgi:hypothetical protein
MSGWWGGRVYNVPTALPALAALLQGAALMMKSTITSESSTQSASQLLIQPTQLGAPNAEQ